MDLGLVDLLVKAVRHPEVPAAFLAGCVLLGVPAWGLAARQGRPQRPAAAAGCGLALALAVTVVRPVGTFPAGGLSLLDTARECVLGDLSLARTYEQLNVAMLVPFAFFATLATRRPGVVAASCVLISVFVEFVQGATGGGTCQARDVVHNAAGGVLGALLALAWLAVRGLSSGRDSRVSAGCGAGRGSSR